MTHAPSIQVLILMAGKGSRFYNQGIKTPKPIIQFSGLSFWKIALGSLWNSEIDSNVFAATIDSQTMQDIHLSGWPVTIIPRDQVSSGPAHTAIDALSNMDQEQPVTIIDCDLWIEAPQYFKKLSELIGEKTIKEFIVVPTFRSDHPGHCYVKRGQNQTIVQKVAEKKPISSEAIAGVYTFSSPKLFKKLYELIDDDPHKEKFLSSLIQKAIEQSIPVFAIPTEAHISLGTPEEVAKINLETLPNLFPTKIENFEQLMRSQIDGN